MSYAMLFVCFIGCVVALMSLVVSLESRADQMDRILMVIAVCIGSLALGLVYILRRHEQVATCHES